MILYEGGLSELLPPPPSSPRSMRWERMILEERRAYNKGRGGEKRGSLDDGGRRGSATAEKGW